MRAVAIGRAGVFLSLALAALACAAPPPQAAPAPGPTPARVCVDGRRFVRCGSREPFVPWGFNYDHDRGFRLLEDYWEREPRAVEEDFAEMRALGANVARI